jgi:hypothetical protein
MAQLTDMFMDTSRQLYKSTNTRHPYVLIMHHTSGICLYMAPKLNT